MTELAAAAVAAIAMAAGAAGAGGDNLDDGKVAARVVEFARARLGERVGDGQCTSLAFEALRAAGARTPTRNDPAWGDQRASLADVHPGDVLQFENAVFVNRKTLDDGRTETFTATFDHHTAVVAAVRRRGPRPLLVVLHQNAGLRGVDDEGRKLVQEWSLDFAGRKKGVVNAFRPVAVGGAP